MKNNFDSPAIEVHNNTNICFICNSEKSKHYANWQKYQYVQCTTCDLVYLNNMPSEIDIHNAYSGGRFKSIRRKITAPFRTLEQLSGYHQRVPDFERRLKTALPYLLNTNQVKMLDIGCNKGFLLTAGINLGFDVSGVELVPELTIQFKRKYKQFSSNIYHGDFSSLYDRLGKNNFNLITAFDLVEHLRNPRADFERIYHIMQPGGVFLFQTPDTSSKEAKILQEKWGSLKAYEHYHLFNSDNIKAFGKQLEFRQVTIVGEELSENGDMMVIMIK